MFRRLKFFLFLFPLVEIALFVLIGGRIGFWATFGIIFGTAALGSWMVSRQKTRSFSSLRAGGLAQLSAPSILDGASIFFAGILLILPGFLTDFLGILLLISPLRRGILRLIMPRSSNKHPQTPQGDYIETSYSDVTDPPRH